MMNYYSAIKRNELLVHAATRMNLKVIIMSKRSQTKEYLLWDSTYVKL